MNVYSDYEDLFKTLNAYGIKYLLVGAYAVIYYTRPRFTKDIDIWVLSHLNDTHKLYEALIKFGAPLKGLKPDDFKDNDMILQIGIAPVRIDILLNLPGASPKVAWRNKKKIRYGKTPVYVIGKQDLVAVKKKAGRPQDKLDLEDLRKFT